MYLYLKKILKTILPSRLLFKFEPMIRKIIFQFYHGSKHHCNICNSNIRSFILIKNGDKLCPHCGSLARNRRIWTHLSSMITNQDTKVLDFSPSRSLYRKMKSILKNNYHSSDLSGDFISDYQFDITNIKMDDNYYDLVICYHVLEHVPNDLQAMKELFRVIKQGGLCIIQTPFKSGHTYEDSSIVSDEDRSIHFGQSDHVRIYSVNDLESRLTNCGFSVEVQIFEEDDNNVFGFQSQETILFCRK